MQVCFSFSFSGILLPVPGLSNDFEQADKINPHRAGSKYFIAIRWFISQKIELRPERIQGLMIAVVRKVGR